MSETVSLSELDSKHFGVITAKSNLVNAHNFQSVVDFCLVNQVNLLIARCSATDMVTVHTMEENGFQLMDTLIYFKINLINYSYLTHRSPANIRPVQPDDISQIIHIAKSAFTDYYGHYHSDPRLDRHKATEVYSSWTERCCTEPGVADCVLVAELDGIILGFRAIRMNSALQGEFILAGVKPEARNQGLYRAFVIEGLNYCKKKGAVEVLNSTHLLNSAVQKTCIQTGFKYYQSYYTFHNWFD